MASNALESEREKKVGKSAKRELKGITGKLLTLLGVCASLYYLLFISGALSRIGIHIQSIPHGALLFGLINILVIFYYPATKNAPKDKLPWYDVLLILLNALACGYVFFFYDPVIISHFQLLEPSIVDLLFGGILIIIIIETTRCTIGWAMVVVVVFCFFHTFYAQYFPGLLYGRNHLLSDVISYQYMTSEGIWGVALQTVSLIVVMFIIFGSFLAKTGIGDFFNNLAFSLVGHIRGGPAKVALITSGLFGMISGSTSANVATTGVFTIPLMKRVGYTADFAGAVEAVASNGGQIVPPVMGVVAFILAELLGISYLKVCFVSILPAFVYYLALFVMVDLEAAKSNLKGLPREDMPSLKKVIKEGWYYMIPVLMLMYFMIGPGYPPETSCFFALLILIGLSMIKKKDRITPRKMIEALEDGAKGMMSVMPAVASAGLIMGCISLSGVAYNLSGLLVETARGNMLILLCLAATSCFILGMGMTSVPCYLIVATLVAPALGNMGVPVLAAHLFVFWYGITSFITPPVAVGAYVAASIANGNVWKTGWIATRLGIVTFIIPFMFVYNPALLFMGSLGTIVLSTCTTIVGVAALAAGISGYIIKPMNWVERFSFVIGSCMLIYPGWTTDLLGAILVGIPFFWHIRHMKLIGRKKAEKEL